MFFFDPGNVVIALFLAPFGLAIAVIALVIQILFDRLPFRQAAYLIPPAIVVASFVWSFLHTGHLETPESYGQHWATDLVSALLSAAFLILTPLPVFRRFYSNIPSYAVVLVAGIGTYFILALFGMIGGEVMYSGNIAFQMRLDLIILTLAELIVATGMYGILAFLDKFILSAANEK